MFTRFISLLVLFASLVSALTINTPTGVTNGGSFNLSWVMAPNESFGGHECCKVSLANTLILGINNSQQIGSINVVSSGFEIVQLGNYTPSDGYTVEFIEGSLVSVLGGEKVIDIGAIAESAPFSIGPAILANTTATPSESTSVSGSSSSSTDTSTAATSTTPSSNTSPISSVSGGGTTASAANSSPTGTGSSTKPTEAIIGGVIGGLVLISLLLALFFFNRRRRLHALGEKSCTIPSPNVVNPFTVPPSNPTSTFLPKNYTSNGQSFPSQPISNNFTQRGQPSDPVSTSGSGGFPPLTPQLPQFSSPAFIPPSSSRLPLTGSQTNLDDTRTEVPQAATGPSRQQLLPSPRLGGADARYLRHEDSGVRIPPAEDDLVELPPFYTPE